MQLKLAPEAPHGPFAFDVSKNFDFGNSCGPWAVVDEVDDPAEFRRVLTVNGVVRQDWHFSDMRYNFDGTFRFLSHNLTRQHDDMLASETDSGVAFEVCADGPYLLLSDTVEISIERGDAQEYFRTLVDPRETHLPWRVAVASDYSYAASHLLMDTISRIRP